MLVGLDFETFGAVDLPTYGLAKYVNDESFRPLLASVACLSGTKKYEVQTFDFVHDPDALEKLAQKLAGHTIVAHNASFERAVLARLGIIPPAVCDQPFFRDSAVVARAWGAGQRLEQAAPQLIGANKMESGVDLIRTFSMPLADGRVLVDEVDQWTPKQKSAWEEFAAYCELDATLGLRIVHEMPQLPEQEWAYEQVTQHMNDEGWYVDLMLVEAMQVQYELNLERIESRFREQYEASVDKPLNFRSTPQLREWCLERGIRSKSFDEKNVVKLYNRIAQRVMKLAEQDPEDERLRGYREVLGMLSTKQELGGSSLSKLETILDLTSSDGRLRNQYLHVGAGQTFRTSGRGAQLQNLKRLAGQPGDVLEGVDGWSNDQMAENLRQVFLAEHPQGRLIVGDFAAVESRGLAYLAGAQWKLDEYAAGRDMYKVLASQMMGVPYDMVTKEQRQTGKVGELSCGYGAGPGAVSRFAENMGEDISVDEAGEIVSNWREANPQVVEFWRDLDRGLQKVASRAVQKASIRCGPKGLHTVNIYETFTVDSIREVNASAASIAVEIRDETDGLILRRYFPGVFLDGRDVCYMKGSNRKSGPLWDQWWTKDGERGRYKLYGGKLTGILTQSFCREIFFKVLYEAYEVFRRIPNVKLVGQFHDEIVVEWSPQEGRKGERSLEAVQTMLRGLMTSEPHWARGFPLGASVNSDRRYIK